MILAGIGMLRDQQPSGGDCALPGGGVNWKGCLPKAIGSGLAVGFLTGLFGVGGGFLIIPALVLLLGLPMHHGQHSTTITSRLAQGPGGEPRTPVATIEIRDHGGGFDPAFLPHAFDRFTRADPARGRGGTPGTARRH
jgi:signal transduction histidine kinase